MLSIVGRCEPDKIKCALNKGERLHTRRVRLRPTAVALAGLLLLVQAPAAGTAPPTLPPCPDFVTLVPTAGPVGTQVDLSGRCDAIHSGGHADVYFDSKLVAGVSGDASGNYHTVFSVPLIASPGVNGVAVFAGHEIGLEAFVVTSQPCLGDCRFEGRVTSSDLLTMTLIALGSAPVSECIAGDPNHDGKISIEEIAAAVTNARIGTCPFCEGCFGDCDLNGEISSTELLRMLDIALGERSLLDCPSGDVDCDGQITMGELLYALDNLLYGCP